MRWRLRLEEYDYDIRYHKGKENKAADALSRFPLNRVNITTENKTDTVETPENETDTAIEETIENIDEYLEELINNALDTPFEKYEKWKRRTPTLIKDTTNRSHWPQHTKQQIDDFNEKKWFNFFLKTCTDATTKNIHIGL